LSRATIPWLAALIAALLLPFLLVDVPPVLDYPNHLARWFVLAHGDDPILSRFYAPNWHITPNLGFDPIAMLLLKLLPVHAGGRLVLAASLLAPVVGALAYAKAAFGKWSGWPLGVTLTGFNGIFFLGFANFLLATGLGFAAAGAWLALRRRGQDLAAVLVGAVAGAAVFLCHIFGVGLFALLIGCQEFAGLRKANWSGLPRTAAMIAIALIPAVALYWLSPLAGNEVAVAGWDGSHKLWDLFTPFMTYNKFLTLATGLAVLLVLIFSWRGAETAPGTGLALALLFLLYLAAPVTLKGGTFVDVRFALMMGLLIFAGLRPRLSPGHERWLMLGILALVALRSLYTGWAWMDHRRDLADLRLAMAQVEPGALVLAVRSHDPVTDAATPERLLPDTERLDSHLPALLVIERRAFWPNLFADPVQQPVSVRPPYARVAWPLYDPVDWDAFKGPLTPGLLGYAPYLRNWRGDFDHVLLIDRPANIAPPAGLTPVYVGDYAALYRIVR
jgi:hypothetical protein